MTISQIVYNCSESCNVVFLTDNTFNFNFKKQTNKQTSKQTIIFQN